MPTSFYPIEPDIHYFHGTSISSAKKILGSGVDLSLGGGELGRGFYLTEKAYIAFAWSEKKYKRQRKVLMFRLSEDDFFNLHPLPLSYNSAVKIRSKLKEEGTTRTYIFGENIVWSPIVGKNSVHEDQIKIESDLARSTLEKNKPIGMKK